MLSRHWSRWIAVCLSLAFFGVSGCGKPQGTATPSPSATEDSKSQQSSTGTGSSKPQRASTADAGDVKAAKSLMGTLGSRASFAPKEGDLLTEIVIKDGSNLTAENLALFGKLSDLEKLQIYNCRTLNDEMAASLSHLKGLTSLALTNSAVSDQAVEMIVKSFPALIDLDLSSNTNMTNGVIKILGELGKLQRLTLVQNKVNDIGAQRLAKFQDLRSLDMRGNMEAGNMALDVVADLPKLTAFKHRSTAVDDIGMESLSRSKTLESLLLQDFVMTDQSGPHLAKLGKLSQLEIFRCQGFGSEGVLALAGMGLTRLTLRDLPSVDNRGMEVFDNLPALRRLFLHELSSVGDDGLKHLSGLKKLELLDIWTISQMTDATVDVIAALPNLKELSIRATGVSDRCIDQILKMPNLQSLTFKENGAVTTEGLKKLSSKKWTKLDTGSSGTGDAGE